MKEMLHQLADAILLELKDEGCYIDYDEAMGIAMQRIQKECQDKVEGRT